MLLLFVSEPPRGFREVSDVERSEYPALSRRLTEQLHVVECFQRSIAGGRHHVVPPPRKGGSNGWRDISVKEDSAGHSGLNRFQPR